jgi:hypothetical protein
MSAYATCSFEIEIGITGTYDAPDRSVGCPGGYLDHEVVDLGNLKHQRDSNGKSVWVSTSLLKGVDLRSKDIQQLFSNILEHCDLQAWAAEADANASDAYDYEMERRRESGLYAGQAGRGL